MLKASYIDCFKPDCHCAYHAWTDKQKCLCCYWCGNAITMKDINKHEIKCSLLAHMRHDSIGYW